MPTTLKLDQIGEVKVYRRRGQKRTTLRLGKNGAVKVSTNLSTPNYAIKKFIIQNQKWIETQLVKTGKNQKVEVFDGQQICPGLNFKFEISAKPSQGLAYRYRYSKKLKDQTVFIDLSSLQAGADLLPPESITLSPEDRVELEPLVLRAIRKQAQLYLPQRLGYLSDKTGLKYSSISVRNTSSRWGSCTSDNTINLSLWLMIVPTALSDYVLIHELVHTKFKNHKAEFWQEVGRHVPEYKKYRKDLKRYHEQIWW